jgi:hypothetical protein
MVKYIRITVFVILYLLAYEWAHAEEVDLMWDANTESDLKGYKIYYGITSRYDSSLDKAAIYQAVKDKYCSQYVLKDPENFSEEEKENIKNSLEECEKGIDDFCPEVIGTPDKLCDFDFYQYDAVVDVKNVVEYKLTGLTKGVKYFLAASAYNDKGHESRFSAELEHTASDVSAVLNFRKVPSAE